MDVQIASSADDIPASAVFERWAGDALGNTLGSAQICVRIVDEAEIAELNESYRGRTGPTNVLSFAFDATECTEPPLLGDIIICAPVVAREAAIQGKTLEAHYAHMLVHGILHLLGYDHENETEARGMEDLECAAMHTLGFANPYAAPVQP